MLIPKVTKIWFFLRIIMKQFYGGKGILIHWKSFKLDCQTCHPLIDDDHPSIYVSIQKNRK